MHTHIIGKVCSILETPENTEHITHPTYYYATNITYSCIEGYQLSDGYLVRKCTLDNTWSGYKPTCTSTYSTLVVDIT